MMLVWRAYLYIYIYIYQTVCSCKNRDFDFGKTDILNNTYQSSIAEHQIINCDWTKKFSVDFFCTLSKSHSSSHLKILATIDIVSCRPSLRQQKERLFGPNIISLQSQIWTFYLTKHISSLLQ